MRASSVRQVEVPSTWGQGWDLADADVEHTAELRRMIDAASDVNPDDLTPDLDGFPMNEDGVALAFAKRHAHELRYCHHTDKWFWWTGQVWQLEETKLAFSWARQTCRDIAAGLEPDRKVKHTLATAAASAGVERFARADRVFAVTSAIWDADPFLLGTPGGTVELTTGRLRPAAQADYITKATAIAPAASAVCPTWLRFLQDATAGDAELIRFLQSFAGYMLTGDTREHALMFIYGPGGNGKSVFLNTLAGILGGYATTAPMTTFIASRNEQHPTDLAGLKGARLVAVSETEEGKPWAEVRIKQMTGGDTISARFMRGDFFQYRPTFKLLIVGNHKPVLQNVDEAVRRRFNIVPFVHTPPDKDLQLEAKLRAEWPGILRWMIDGCLTWQRDGLVKPAAVTSATEDYFAAQDVFGQWVAERCKLDPNLQVRPGELLNDFNAWAAANGVEAANRVRFRGWAEKQTALRYKKVKGMDWLAGIGLLPPEGAGVGRGGHEYD